MSMKLFLVTRDGVYRHEVLGVYSSREAAVERAKQSSNDDGYHEYTVSKTRLDVPVEDVIDIESWRRNELVRPAQQIDGERVHG